MAGATIRRGPALWHAVIAAQNFARWIRALPLIPSNAGFELFGRECLEHEAGPFALQRLSSFLQPQGFCFLVIHNQVAILDFARDAQRDLVVADSAIVNHDRLLARSPRRPDRFSADPVIHDLVVIENE